MSHFVAWYRPPHGAIAYIKEYPAGNFFQEYYSAGRESVSDISQATRYPTREEAMRAVPVYDGSDNIGGRSGVIEVGAPGEAVERERFNPFLAVFLALVALYFVWQFTR